MSDFSSISTLKYLGGFVLVFAVLLGILIFVKRYSIHGGINRKEKRLFVTDVLSLDPKNRLVMIKRDNIEHLILLGPTQNTLIESGIDWSGEKKNAFQKSVDSNDSDIKAEKI